MNKYYFGFFFFLAILLGPVYGQKSKQLIDSLNQRSYDTLVSDAEVGLELARTALMESEKLGYDKGAGEAYLNIGSIKESDGEGDSAVVYYNKALRIFIKLKDSLQMGRSYSYLCSILQVKGDYAAAEKSCKQALTIGQKLKNVKLEADTENLLGIIDDDQGAFAEAMEHYMRSLELFESIDLVAGQGSALSNIASVHNIQGRYEEALDYYSRAFTLHEEVGNIQEMAGTLANIGALYLFTGRYDDANSKFDEAYKTFELLGNQYGQAVCLNNSGYIFSLQGVYDSAITRISEALRLYRNIDSKQGIAESLSNLGEIYDVKGDLSTALDFYQQAMQVELASNNKHGISDAYLNIGGIQESQGNLNAALDNYFSALKIQEEIGDPAGSISAHLLITHMFCVLEEYDVAEDHIEGAQLLLKQVESPLLHGDVLKGKGELFAFRDLPDSAIYYYSKSYGLFQEMEMVSYMADLDIKTGAILNEQGNYDKALTYLNRAFDDKQELEELTALIGCYYHLAKAHLGLNHNDKALKFALSGLATSESTSYDELKMDLHDLLSEIYRSKGSYKDALFHQSRHLALSTEIFERAKVKDLNELQTKYDSEKKRQEIENLKLEKQLQEVENDRISLLNLVYLFAILLITVLAILFVTYLNRRNKKRLLKSKLEGQEKERQRLSRELHDGVGASIAGQLLALEAKKDVLGEENLDHVVDNLKSIYQEVRSISHDLSSPIFSDSNLQEVLEDLVLKYNQQDQIELTLEVYPRIDWGSIEINIQQELYRIIQESIINAFKHSECTEISVQMVYDQDTFRILVEDNGRGMMSTESDGIGLQNLQSRVEALDGSISVDSHPGRGTSVNVEVPVRQVKIIESVS